MSHPPLRPSSVLLHEATGQVLAHRVHTASSLFTRMRGLIGTSDLKPCEALWIVPCRGIHTWFMKFPIDVVFVTKTLQLVAVFENTRPFRLAHPPWFSGTYSVFEFKTPALKQFRLKARDQLRLVPPPAKG